MTVLESQQQVRPLSPEERLEIALSSRNNSSLLREAIEFVGARVRHKYPEARLIYTSAAFIIDYHLSERIPVQKEKWVFGDGGIFCPSFWRGKHVAKTSYRERYLVTAGCFDSHDTLNVHVNDADLYRACQEVTNLTHGRVRTQL